MKKVMMFALTLFASIMIIPTTYALGDDVTTNEVTYVASVGGKNYETVQEAINNANGQTVTLLTDVTESVTISNGTTVTLDLGSYTLTNKEGEHTITNNGNLKVIGSGTVDNVSHAKAAVFNDKTGTATLKSGTYTRSKEAGESADQAGGNSFYTIQNYGYMVIEEDVKVLNKGSFSSLLENGFHDGNSLNLDGSATPTLIINGGLFDGGLNTIKNDDYGVLTINGGTFTNVAQAALLNWNKATINGGTFISDKYAVLNGKIDDVMDTGTLVINNGTFNAGVEAIAKMNNVITDFDNVSVKGGIFSTSVDEGILDIEDDKALLLDGNGNYVIANKLANYDRVNELVNQAENIDRSKYTEESVKVLDDIIEAIDYKKNGLQQDDVDKMADDIENAIKSLVKKTETIVPENPDVDFPDFPDVDLPENEVKDEEVNPKTSDSISYAYIALFISGIGMLISLKRLA